MPNTRLLLATLDVGRDSLEHRLGDRLSSHGNWTTDLPDCSRADTGAPTTWSFFTKPPVEFAATIQNTGLKCGQSIQTLCAAWCRVVGKASLGSCGGSGNLLSACQTRRPKEETSMATKSTATESISLDVRVSQLKFESILASECKMRFRCYHCRRGCCSHNDEIDRQGFIGRNSLKRALGAHVSFKD